MAKKKSEEILDNELDILHTQIRCLNDMWLTTLENRIESLKNTLEWELQAIRKSKEEGKQYSPNACGIVQGSGMDIDELCIKLGTLRAVKQ